MHLLEIISGVFKFLGSSITKATEIGKEVGTTILSQQAKSTRNAEILQQEEQKKALNASTEENINEITSAKSNSKTYFDNLEKTANIITTSIAQNVADNIRLKKQNIKAQKADEPSNLRYNWKKFKKKVWYLSFRTISLPLKFAEDTAVDEFLKIKHGVEDFVKSSSKQVVELKNKFVALVDKQIAQADARAEDVRQKVSRQKKELTERAAQTTNKIDLKKQVNITYYEHEKQRKERLHRVILAHTPDEEKEIIQLQYENEIESLTERMQLDQNTIDSFAMLSKQILTLNSNFTELAEELNETIHLNQNADTELLGSIQDTVLASSGVTTQGQEQLAKNITETAIAQNSFQSELTKLSSQQLNDIANNILNHNNNVDEHLDNIEENQNSVQEEARSFHKDLRNSQDTVLTASVVAAQTAESNGSLLIKLAKKINGSIEKNRENQNKTAQGAMQNYLNNMGKGKENEDYRGMSGSLFKVMDTVLSQFVRILEDPYNVIVNLAEGVGASIGRIVTLVQLILQNLGYALLDYFPELGSFLMHILPSAMERMFGISVPDLLLVKPDPNKLLKAQMGQIMALAVIEQSIEDIRHGIKNVLIIAKGILDTCLFISKTFLNMAKMIVISFYAASGSLIGKLIESLPSALFGGKSNQKAVANWFYKPAESFMESGSAIRAAHTEWSKEFFDIPDHWAEEKAEHSRRSKEIRIKFNNDFDDLEQIVQRAIPEPVPETNVITIKPSVPDFEALEFDWSKTADVAVSTAELTGGQPQTIYNTITNNDMTSILSDNSMMEMGMTMNEGTPNAQGN
jgi:hypothetical protein